MEVSFTIPGQPGSKGRPRFRRAGNFVSTYTPSKTVQYENLVRLEYQQQCGNVMFPQGAPLEMEVKAYFQVPKSATKSKKERMIAGKVRPTVKPDLDNLIKVIADASNKVAYYDDSQIVSATVRKYYSDNPRVEVTIRDAS